MPRVLAAAWVSVPEGERPEAIRAWRARRDSLASDGCRYWIFSSGDNPESYLEFTEAGDEATLRRARERAGLAPDHPILAELELS